MEEERGVVQYIARDGANIKLSPSIIKAYLVSGYPDRVTDQELYLYMGLCKSRGLNPFIRDCYLIKYGSNDAAAIIVSIDYYRKRARAQADCKGWRCGIVVLNRENEIENREGCIILDGETLLGGWFEALPDGYTYAMKKVVPLARYIKRTKEGKVTRFWSEENQPEQICKVAESQGLRATWPDEFQGLYTDAERESMEAQAGFDESVATAAEVESKKEELQGTLGKAGVPAQGDDNELGSAAPPPPKPPEKKKDKAPATPPPIPPPPANGSPEDMRASAMYKEFDPYAEAISQRYAKAKILKLTDELDKHGISYAKSWSGSQLHMTLRNNAPPTAPEIEKTSAPDPQPDPPQEDAPDPDDDPQVVLALQSEIVRVKHNEPEIYRYAYTNQLQQGNLRPETKTSEWMAAECRAVLQDVNEQIALRNQTMME